VLNMVHLEKVESSELQKLKENGVTVKSYYVQISLCLDGSLQQFSLL
jgi:hypothetical protein